MANIIDILSKRGVIAENQIFEVRKRAKDESKSTEDVLYSMGISETDVLSAKSESLGIPSTSLESLEIPFDVLECIPEESARYYKFVPIAKSGGFLTVGMLNPEDMRAQDALRFIVSRLGLSVQIFLIKSGDLERVLGQYKNVGGEVTKALSEFQEDMQETYGGKKGSVVAKQTEEAGKISEEAPVTKMMAVILRYGVEGGASDIHIEPTQDKVKIRFRVDGILYTGLFLPKNVQMALLTKIKVMTNMKIDESRVPQDGRFHARILDKEIDFRVSTFPTSFGEKVAIRILDPTAVTKSMADLGIEGRNLKILEENIKKPYGMILITGPTGSGKSTTLYAILKEMDSESLNVVSLEDPIEYYIPGVNQSQVRPEIKYDFATGLRNILRQDPDIIMVGEIRDKETAQLAVHAALTGHLVLSTLHTNNAIGVIPRLIDMGVDPFLIPSTLVLAIAQRLTRKLCPESRKEVKIEGKYKEIIEREIVSMPLIYQEEVKKMKKDSIYVPEISTVCPKGTRGRIGVFEVLEMTKELEKIILEGPSEDKIIKEARRQNMITMREDGILKALRGIIGVEELMEVT
ncbi:MAG: hypothetical protein A3G49_03625 [Candidatus Sungbacteria bacterium RIFCSPLOWO2_12_FULL_41_11]|uniref:Bacterial type II secretion system protein E domain-containing protein n=1 Tax=Candidatus Sungbacteria bacterium RIFCSPLOWO2_12_FULL_41_11 TaxID=1802286 RepID=A0A1G2LS31_9BACT|nr:MAG: hypothetical protein A3D41_01255 [Candidatus Sungbacteria bacterium RIFCSPHIGHO2_02_FULL_41_12b]OHA14304.1 MAG: hypothetical protein A3G49_03625 [Candidatus Sungbacteria bacterium RIFCSPLOWO2_12_FULL_41_11]